MPAHKKFVPHHMFARLASTTGKCIGRNNGASTVPTPIKWTQAHVLAVSLLSAYQERRMVRGGGHTLQSLQPLNALMMIPHDDSARIESPPSLHPAIYRAIHGIQPKT